MRLNPFSKKSAGSSSGYYARIKAEFDQAERELAKTRKAHAQAQADYDAERAEYQRIKDSLNPRRVERSPQEDRQWARVTAAHDIVQPLASAAATFRTAWLNGKFQGVIARQTPTGSRRTC